RPKGEGFDDVDHRRIPPPRGGARRSPRSRTSATMVDRIVAMRVVPTIAVGSPDPAAARTAMTVPGRSVTLDVQSAKKVHISSEASGDVRLRSERSFMALRPRGVAAFPKPSML